MRIAVNGWFWRQMTTGSGQYLSALLARLPEIGREHELLLVRPASAERPDATSRPAGWQWVDVRPASRFLGRRLGKVWFEQVTFPRACRRLRADVALVPYWGAPWWQPCPVAVTVHDLIPLLLPPYRGGTAQRLYTRLVSGTARRAAAVLTDSAASRRDILDRLHLPPGRVHAIHLAAPPGFAPVTDEAALGRVRQRYALPAAPFFLYLGGYDNRKNVVRLLEAYARLANNHPEAPPLVLAGILPEHDTPFAPDPRPVAARLGIAPRLCYPGWIAEEDKPALYSLALGALFVSEYEGFGLPVLEAQACGCPVIAAR